MGICDTQEKNTPYTVPYGTARCHRVNDVRHWLSGKRDDEIIRQGGALKEAQTRIFAATIGRIMRYPLRVCVCVPRQ